MKKILNLIVEFPDDFYPPNEFDEAGYYNNWTSECKPCPLYVFTDEQGDWCQFPGIIDPPSEDCPLKKYFDEQGEVMTKTDFENTLKKWSSSQRFYYNSHTNQCFLIDKQNRCVIEIKNEAVKKFIYKQVYAHNINETDIDTFIQIGGFKMTEYIL